MKKIISQHGYVTLLFVITIGAVGLATILSIASLNTKSISTVDDIYKSKQATALSDACAETALQEIRNSSGFSGSGSLSLGNGNCFYTASNLGGENRQVESTGTVGNIVRKVKILTDVINPQINVVSWQEVADF